LASMDEIARRGELEHAVSRLERWCDAPAL
jgi:hypothetical protein